MSNANVTLAQIRAGSATLGLDSSNYSPAAEAVQKALKKMGYYAYNSDVYDGKFGALSVAAVKAFQKMKGLTVTGVVDKNTLSQMESYFTTIYNGHSTTPTLLAVRYNFDVVQKGDSGAAVTKVRSMLNAKGYSVATSGSFDDTLEGVVASFQSANNLVSDGIVGQRTYLALENTTSTSGWLTNGTVKLTAGLLAQCGFSGVLLSFYVDKLNNALNSYGINTPEKVKHFLAQCMAETAAGTLMVEGGYQAGSSTGSKSYAPYYGAGFIHLTHDYNYEDFYNYMKNTKGITDAKIKTPAEYATQYVAEKYANHSAGWFWKEHAKFNSSVDWSASARTICNKLTDDITGSSSDRSRRYGYYTQISAVLK